MKEEVEKILVEQMKLLHERSKDIRDSELYSVTKQMIDLSKCIDGEKDVKDIAEDVAKEINHVLQSRADKTDSRKA
ncbi:hypothetical protein [uncultured Selenomonas sp.]|uniref:hypothetical protein n=1 Tax=uncultured Selenomonas sp. TaxID=159275 RepID=UPI0025FF1D3D|nr:hypothetical protein [uncultured Selenomonas sp.]